MNVWMFWKYPQLAFIDIFNYFVCATLVRACCFHITKTDPNDTTSEDKLNPPFTFVADLG